jgi:diguanylate cyclase
MGNAASQKYQGADIGSQIAQAMRTMGVAPIPRNYELFYEAFIGSNPALTRDFAALGKNATQLEIDKIGAKYFAHHHRSAFIDGAQIKVTKELENFLGLLKEEQDTLEGYNRVLTETVKHIDTKSEPGSDHLRKAISVLSNATDKTVDKGEKMVETVVQRTQELDVVRQELEEYKRIANTDSLTRLANRRAFDEKLIAIYNNPRSRNAAILILADIDNFKKINDTYGHPIGDKVLATVATVIKTNVRRDVFVARAGGEEFAIVLFDNTETEAQHIAERIRKAVEATPFTHSKTGADFGTITLSMGFCPSSLAEDPNDLYTKADIALYSAKNSGRNRTCAYNDGMKKNLSKNWMIYKS